ncbi:signal peptidase I [Shewanella schlegeliana]|uniref:Signal peptidase I n=1 Tax=Shewanella schlegeliana TaxID=190308 RepID=A0ABS1T3X5_9GAMM|nr:signal peptidase I [Shewanella schlegeliana]MBL4915280.1 signal peptidase I [Shewanella schlegeliana]MCL1111209.1 signal peptidase I [Shewanella schlegeliana]GIU34185.1 signal peptidase I [Shewanella schlegeliana]
MNKVKLLWKDNRQLVLFIILMSVCRSAIADWYTVPTGSMQPTIKEGDRIVVDKMAYDLRVPFTQISLLTTGEPERGEIVIFESKAADSRLIKRVVGLPGDTVGLNNEILVINGKALDYSLVTSDQRELIATENLNGLSHSIRIEKDASVQLSSFETVTVPEGHYLVMGDNRRNSADSRVYGFVPRGELRGKATRVAFSLDYENHYLPREERFFTNLYSD